MEIKITIDAEGIETAIHTLSQVLAGLDLPLSVKKVVVGDEEPKGVKETVATEVAEPEAPAKEEAASQFTFTQVRSEIAKIAQQGKQAEIKELLTSMGAAKLSDIPEARYGELLEKAGQL